jgi:hypothetical protein
MIAKKAFSLNPFVCQGDFSASGSGNLAGDRSWFDERCVKLAFEATEKLKLQVGPLGKFN